MNRVEEALKRARDLSMAPAAPALSTRPGADERQAVPSLAVYPAEGLAHSEPAAHGGDAAADLDRRSSEQIVPVQISKSYDGKLVMSAASHAFSIEQYRRLAAAVHHLQVEQGLNRLMVSSS